MKALLLLALAACDPRIWEVAAEITPPTPAVAPGPQPADAGATPRQDAPAPIAPTPEPTQAPSAPPPVQVAVEPAPDPAPTPAPPPVVAPPSASGITCTLYQRQPDCTELASAQTGTRWWLVAGGLTTDARALWTLHGGQPLLRPIAVAPSHTTYEGASPAEEAMVAAGVVTPQVAFARWLPLAGTCYLASMRVVCEGQAPLSAWPS